MAVTHHVKSPFMCRKGQFVRGERSLCIGLDLNTVIDSQKFICYLGNNKKICYKISSRKALSLGEKYDSFWENPEGKEIIILPLFEFEKYTNKDGTFEKMEKIKVEQQELF